ncbi:MAG: glycosyltransferase [Candidatus Micrarchaeaceae archaeon]
MDINQGSSKSSVSVIIPFKRSTPSLYECLNALINQTMQNFEIICIPDSEEVINIDDKRIRTMPKPGTPTEKRNYGVSLSESENIAFIDDDAVPAPNWLELGILDLANEGVVGGPNVAPKGENARKLASDLFLTSPFGSFREVYRYKPVRDVTYVDNILTVNMFVRKEIFNKIGGFTLKYWPGEDTHFCEDLKRAGYRIFYDPNLVVYHHRRNVFHDHLIQIWRYAKYRGGALKIGEFKPFYLIPSVLVIAVILIFLLSIRLDIFITVSILAILIAASIVIFADFYAKSRNVRGSLLGVLTVWLSHITYGIGVLYGIIFVTLDLEN